MSDMNNDQSWLDQEGNQYEPDEYELYYMATQILASQGFPLTDEVKNDPGKFADYSRRALTLMEQLKDPNFREEKMEMTERTIAHRYNLKDRLTIQENVDICIAFLSGRLNISIATFDILSMIERLESFLKMLDIRASNQGTIFAFELTLEEVIRQSLLPRLQELKRKYYSN